MDALQALHSRVSVPLVTEEGPSETELEQILQAGFRAADHGRLRPWRFLRIEGEGRLRLGEVFVRASLADGNELDEDASEKIRSKTLRAPLILVGVASVIDVPKVPEIEQIISTGAAIQNMMNACHAIGLGAMWRTGAMAYHPLVKEALGLGTHEHIVGYLYIGRIRGSRKSVPCVRIEDHVERWPRD